MKKAMTIAGSDSGGGAGIQADLKTFAALKVYGTSVITSVTAQNTYSVTATYDLPAAFVGRQIDAVLEDIGADAAKTGMLANAGIIEIVAAKVAAWKLEKLVVDPVMVAKSGGRLLEEEAVRILQSKLLPLALVATPNLDEAEVLTGMKICSEKDMQEAARRLYDGGTPYIVIKGGHLVGEAVDILFDGHRFYRFVSQRLPGRTTHGTGCTFSAAVTAFLALGFPVPEAVEQAKTYVTTAIRRGSPIGRGYSPVHHFHEFYAWEEQ
ncbi:MAG: hydroxymethylpyrimidine/phosphomethylpyrimidine kinase [Clostridia bacterium]|nr:hydroxymethylpyrimidine/phosphomethylpyrimidine kinase [Clostridia bacterium]